MSGIKAKISDTVNKLTHKSGTDANTTGTSGYDNTGTTGTGVGHHGHHTHGTGTAGGLETGSDYNTTSSTGMGTTGTGMGTTGSEYGTTGTGMGTTTGTTGMGTTGGMTTGATMGTGEIIDSETFTKTEDHEVLIEKKRYELEHRPVQKQYVVETKYVGEQAVPGAPTEVVGNESKIVDEHIKQAPAGDRTVVVENVDVPGSEMRTATGMGMGSTSTTGTGMGTGTTGTGMGGQQTY
jgi:hypothetical protein